MVGESDGEDPRGHIQALGGRCGVDGAGVCAGRGRGRGCGGVGVGVEVVCDLFVVFKFS